jgi:hypothetical protein
VNRGRFTSGYLDNDRRRALTLEFFEPCAATASSARIGRPSQRFATRAQGTMERSLAATRKRHASRIAGELNEQEQNFRTGSRMNFEMTGRSARLN